MEATLDTKINQHSIFVLAISLVIVGFLIVLAVKLAK